MFITEVGREVAESRVQRLESAGKRHATHLIVVEMVLWAWLDCAEVVRGPVVKLYLECARGGWGPARPCGRLASAPRASA